MMQGKEKQKQKRKDETGVCYPSRRRILPPHNSTRLPLTDPTHPSFFPLPSSFLFTFFLFPPPFSFSRAVSSHEGAHSLTRSPPFLSFPPPFVFSGPRSVHLRIINILSGRISHNSNGFYKLYDDCSNEIWRPGRHRHNSSPNFI